MKRTERKSDCPINYALESFGDSWSLLIIRDIALYGKKSYKEFLESEERIATNILSQRLSALVAQNILTKTSDKEDGRKEVYSLTDKGLDIIPILIELMKWSVAYDPETNQDLKEWLKNYNAKVARTLRSRLKRSSM